MLEEKFRFLEEPLSGFRSEYIGQLNENVPQLLDVYDAQSLGEYSEQRHNQLKSHPAYLRVMSNPVLQQGEEDRPVYENLSLDLEPLRGEAREAFLYGLRGALLIIQEYVKATEGRMVRRGNVVDDLLIQKNIPEALRAEDNSLERTLNMLMNTSSKDLLALRAMSSAYRDVYRVMADEVRQALPRPDLAATSV
ncbi:hypothetical protein HYT57_05335 [Candidatus Woesearchaeota archaeon]|nr:hypothetical protein [Candidatus Woesearchaeota archaeon]